MTIPDDVTVDRPIRIFVLADTHDRLPDTLAAMTEGADEIWHLGDVCATRVLDLIKTYGPPVTVVQGNCDGYQPWPLVVNLTRNGVRFHLVHIPPERAPAGTDVLLHGHTHVPRNEVKGGVRFLNPGCVTRPNRGAPPSVAILEIGTDGAVNWELLPLG